jgi:D-serine deaminase-like pyridoxal phosphate-dependent protein
MQSIFSLQQATCGAKILRLANLHRIQRKQGATGLTWQHLPEARSGKRAPVKNIINRDQY